MSRCYPRWGEGSLGREDTVEGKEVREWVMRNKASMFLESRVQGRGRGRCMAGEVSGKTE